MQLEFLIKQTYVSNIFYQTTVINLILKNKTLFKFTSVWYNRTNQLTNSKISTKRCEKVSFDTKINDSKIFEDLRNRLERILSNR